MKASLAILSLCITGAAWAAEPAKAPAAPPAPAAAAAPAAAPAPLLTGKVLEVKDTGNYTYLRLKTKDGESWAAVEKAPVKKGQTVSVIGDMLMTNFESQAMKRTFDKIVFGTLIGKDAAAAKPAALPPGHVKPAPAVDLNTIKVAKAEGADARTVAEIAGQKGELKDKPVTVRAKVVKFNGGIMGKNWVHLRDGTGKADDGTNDVLATTLDGAQVGDVVVVKGIVRADKDFGAGYAYKVVIEEAKLSK